MEKVIQAILRQNVLINILFFLCMAVGLFSVSELPVERYPDISMGKVLVSTMLPGASPRDVEALVTQEIEQALDDLESVEFIRSASYRGRSSIVVKFLDDSDYEALFDELRLKVLGVMNELPPGIDPPVFTEISVNMWLPAVTVNLVGERSNRALSLVAEEMKLLIRNIPGVKEVELSGDFVREFHVLLDPKRLEAFNLTFDQVVQALEKTNISVPAGDQTSRGGEFAIVVDERFRTREQVAETILRKDKDGSFVTLDQVMTRAFMSYRDPFVRTAVNAQDCVSLRVIKSNAGNILDIVPQVQALVERYQGVLDKEGLDVVLTQDQRITIQDALNIMGRNLLVGIILVALIIFLFMGPRNALLAMVGIPFSFLVTMIIMWITGNSLNEITIFSFVLVSGIVVDDAIVVVENIYRHVQEGQPLAQAVVGGTAEVAFPVISATSTTVAAFLPMLIMTGSTGEFFEQIPIAISAAIGASLFECLIILPIHFLDWPGSARGETALRHKYTVDQERLIMRMIRKGTNAVVNLCLRFRVTSLLLVLTAFTASLIVLGLSVSGRMPLIPIDFFPADYTYYYLELEGPVGTPLQKTTRELKRITRYLLPNRPEELKSVTGNAGFYLTKDYQPIYGTNLGHLVVELPQKGKARFRDNPANDPELHLEHIRKRLEALISDDWRVRIRPEEGGPPSGTDLSVRVVGPNPEAVRALFRKMSSFIKTHQDIAPHLINLSDDQGQKTRVYRFQVKQQQAAEFGLDPQSVALLAGSVLDGRYVKEFRSLDEDVPLKVKIDPDLLQSPEDGLNVAMKQHPGGPLRLRDLVDVHTYAEPNTLNRFQGNRSITLTADLKPGAPISSPGLVRIISKYYQSIKTKYPGAELSFSGEFESTKRSYISLTYAFIIAVLVIFMILAAQFHSYLQPFIILSAVVFSLIGVIFGKVVTHGVITVTSFIAVVGVTGVVVNDSLVLIHFINKRYQAGMSRKEAIEDGIRVRLRPILLTTLTTSLGLAPMAIGFPSYSPVWGPMASTFVTGLCTATFLTLFIVPIEWDLLNTLQSRFKKRSE